MNELSTIYLSNPVKKIGFYPREMRDSNGNIREINREIVVIIVEMSSVSQSPRFFQFTLTHVMQRDYCNEA